MWHVNYTTKVNFFTVVVQQLGDSQIYRIYARRLNCGGYCPIFRFGAGNRCTIYGDWQTALMDFSSYLSKFNAPLGIRTSQDSFLDKFRKADDTTYWR